jgi:hypothetical protein
MQSQQPPSNGQSGGQSQSSSAHPEHTWVAAALGLPNVAPQWWSQAQPIAKTAEFRDAVEAMRRKAADCLRAVYAVPDHLPFLLRRGLSGEIPRIKKLVIAFDRSAAAALLMISGMARSAAGGVAHPRGKLTPTAAGEPDPVALQLASAANGVPEALADVSAVLGAPAEATVFGAFARWPEYAEFAWSKAKALAVSPVYGPLNERLVAVAGALSGELPWPAAPAGVGVTELAPVHRHAAAHVAVLAAMRLGLAIPDGWRADVEPVPPLRLNPAGDHTARRPAQTA